MTWMRRLLLLLALVGGVVASAAARAGPPLVLDDARGRVDAWPALTQFTEPGAALTLAQARAQAAQFAPPAGARGALGLSRTGVWLRLPLQVAADSDGQWVLDIDYPPLNRVDVHLVDRGGARHLGTLGNLQPHAARPLASRTLALPLALPPGGQAELWLRVQTQGALLVPIALFKPVAFHAQAAQELLLQGVLGGLALFLVTYSLMQWRALREPLFGTYAWLATCTALFSVFQMGVGAQLLWPDQPWIERHAGSLLALLASAGSSLFIEQALRPHRWPGFAWLMRGVAALQLTAAAAHAGGLIDTHQVSRIIGSMGLLPPLLGLPGAIVLARRGSGIGWSLLLAWTAYFAGTAWMVGLIRGHIDAGFWSLHSFQIAATLDMLLFMRVVSLRLREVQAVAQRAAAERESLLQQVQADALTGLANRRGLQAALAERLPQCAPGRHLALYLLDLDDFKTVNDRHGHDTGDALLVAVAQRLRSGVRRPGDLVARLGGDEFIVVASGLPDAAAARDLARQLAALFDAPFVLDPARRLTVRATIGCALAPADGTDAATLLKRADAAMYRGKPSGRDGVAQDQDARPARASARATQASC